MNFTFQATAVVAPPKAMSLIHVDCEARWDEEAPCVMDECWRKPSSAVLRASDLGSRSPCFELAVSTA